MEVFKDNMTSEVRRLQRSRWEIINIWRPLKQVPRDHLSMSDALSFQDGNLIEICGRVPGMDEEDYDGSTNGAGVGVLYATYSIGLKRYYMSDVKIKYYDSKKSDGRVAGRIL